MNDTIQRSEKTAKADRLLSFGEVNRLIGSRCRTGHTARDLMRRGLIKGVHINKRVIRYSENSVRALVSGRPAEAQPSNAINETIQRLDNTAMHLLTEHATLARVIRHCRERQEELMLRLKGVEVLIARARNLPGDQHSMATQTLTGQSDSQKTHAMAVSA
jgi:hypothetical protein